MCGICGFASNNPDQPIRREMLARMTGLLRHRGPDSEGFYVKGGIGLGVRRLSIIDLQGGDQPISNEDETVTVVCNGEIYNYVELRQHLLAAGHRFRTGSDVEVIVHLYEDHADDFPRYLRGMFGLALWDARQRRLVLARDRLGIKPLHYASDPTGIYFASEIKSILASDQVATDMDIRALRDLFTFGFVLSPKTLVTGIQRLPPGHSMTFQGGRIAFRKYWEITFPQQDQYDLSRSPAEWAEALLEKLTESVRLHLRSDVPVGAWLSAGIDSSAVAGLMRQMTSHKIRTFTLRFQNPAFDELIGQKTLDEYHPASFLSQRPICKNEDFRLFPKVVWHSENPFTSGVEITQMILSRFSSHELKVVLTGEGSDELFGGYPWYWADRVLRPFSNLPLWLRRAMASFPISRKKWPGASQILLAPREMNLTRYSSLIGSPRGRNHQYKFFSADLQEELAKEDSGDECIVPEDFSGWHRLVQLQYYDLKTRLPDGIVHQLDRTSMAYSLEARVPFLDHELVEFCAQIPPWLKMKGGQEKHILRQSMQNVLPRDILFRKKRALSAPFKQWLRRDLPDFAKDLLSPVRLKESGYFNPEYVKLALEQHQSGREDNGKLLLGILGIQLWKDLFAHGTVEGASRIRE
jgi:asparagine synthase (glutamine-hydrolysing)